MKKSKYLLFAGIVCLLATACQKDEDSLANITLNKFIVGDTQFKSNDDSKVALQFSNNKLIYEEGDVVKVNGETYTLSKSGSGSSTVWYANGPEITGSQFYCVYADGVSTTISGFSGNSYHYNLGGRLSTASNKILMGGMTQNNVLTLRPACAIIRLPLNDSYSNVKVGFEKNKVYKEGTLNIASDEVTISGMTYMTGVDQSGRGADFLKMEYNTTEGYWYVAVPVSSSINTKLYFYWEQGGDTVGYVTSGQVTLTKGWVYTAGSSRQSPFTDEGSSKCTFNVSSTKKVRFSAGNLQAMAYIGLDDDYHFRWRFAPQQYDVIGGNNGGYIQTEGYYFDLFGYGTSGYNDDQKPNLYTNINNAYYNSDIAGTNYDWGMFIKSNPGIYYGNNLVTTKKWRTLTSDEWNYVINNRSGKSGYATIGSYKGIILLPDKNENSQDWVIANDYPSDIPEFNAALTSYSDNEFRIDEWGKLEATGAIFLPTTGYRNGTGTTNISDKGYYWSTNIGTPSATGNIRALAMQFTGSTPAATNTLVQYGCAVRLVIAIGE